MLDKPVVIGHRGYRGKYPENTLISFEKALELGVWGVEFDVQITKDGQPVISHDSKLGRCCDHEGLISEYTLAELKTFDFGSWKGEQFKGTRIPTLFEALDCILGIAPHVFICCEVKDANPLCADICYEELKRRGKLEECSFISFVTPQLHRLYAKDHDILLHGFRECNLRDFIPGTYDIIRRVGIHINDVTKEEVAWFRERNIETDSWGMDSEAAIDKGLECGVVTWTSDNLEVSLPLYNKKVLGK